MIIKSVNLETVCGVTSTLPQNKRPELAFAGRSNVGKSSLINALINRKAYARTSSKPGKTQTINYYNVNDSVYLTDLPGYGYANANLSAKADWGVLIERYLHTSSALKAVFLLVDIRHEPTEDDVLMCSWIMESGFHPVIIATKLDKIGKNERAKRCSEIRTRLLLPQDAELYPFSALTREGLPEISACIDRILGQKA